MDPTSFPDAHQPHMHTYWLKYFVLKIIVKNGSTQVQRLMRMFIDKGGYEEHLVLHVLGSLCTHNEFGCADYNIVSPPTQIRFSSIRPSQRGRSLFEDKMKNRSELSFSYEYLEAVMDDHWLSYPNKWINAIYKADFGGYMHLFDTSTDYPRRIKETVQIKSFAVLNFLRVLKASLTVEMTENKVTLYKELAENGLIPDFNKIAKNNIESMANIYGTVEPGDTLRFRNSLERTWNASLEKPEYEEFFREYYMASVLVD